MRTVTLHPEIKTLDAKRGLVEYVASDETVDFDREVVRAKGWRFDYLKRNAPFLDSHRSHGTENVLGKVVDFEVKGDRLIETVQWAIDVGLPETHPAMIGWKLTQGGYLKAVSVGFRPIKGVSPHSDPQAYREQLRELGMEDLPDSKRPQIIFTEQQQLELSAVVLGANPNAVARAYKEGCLSEAQVRRYRGVYVPASHRAPFPELSATKEMEEAFARRKRRSLVPFPEVLESRPRTTIGFSTKELEQLFARRRRRPSPLI